MASLLDKVKGVVVDKIARMEKPTADLTDVDVRGVSTDSVGLMSDVIVHNPYDHGLPILEITFRLRCGDREILSGSISDADAVQANSDNRIQVGAKVALDFLINLVRDIGSDWDIDYDFDVTVKFKLPIVKSFTLPLHKKGTIKLPNLNDIVVNSVFNPVANTVSDNVFNPVSNAVGGFF